MFLVENPEEVVFLSCVQDSGVCSNTFCRITELSSTELQYCVASVLGEYLGPRLQTGSTTRDLVKRWDADVAEFSFAWLGTYSLSIFLYLRRVLTVLPDRLGALGNFFLIYAVSFQGAARYIVMESRRALPTR